MKMDKKLLGKRINAMRKNIGITAEVLSEKCNINDTYLRQIECGNKIPSLPVFVDICNALEISPTHLLKDSLGKNELDKFEEFSQLWHNLSPKQMKLAIAMIKTALEFDE